MQTGRHNWFVLVIGMLSLSGCRHSQSVGVNLSPAPPAQPFVFYDETGEPSETMVVLSESEVKPIMDAVTAMTKDKVWFFRVHPSLETGKHGRIIVYLAPHRQTARIRVGNAYTASAYQGKAQLLKPHEYVLVSRPDEPFTEQLAPPSARDLPFVWPVFADSNSPQGAQISEEELIGIADFVREPSHYGRSRTQGVTGKDAAVHAAQQMPIVRIYRYHNREIHVDFGFQHESLGGYGWKVVLERTSGGYRIVDWGEWVS